LGEFHRSSFIIHHSSLPQALPPTATIYTDGSCSTQFLVGAWVAIILTGEEVIRLHDVALQTTHNRMELTAVMKALDYINIYHKNITNVTLCSDSQYVLELHQRKAKLFSTAFTTKAGKALPNEDLVRKFFALSEMFTIELVKIKAHGKRDATNNYNVEADLLSRKLVRERVNKLHLATSILTFLFLIF
jgi:ribonuclease HI